MTIMDRLNTDFESVFKSFADGKASSSENVAAALSLPQPRAAATINSVSDGDDSSSLPSGESEPSVTLALAPSGFNFTIPDIARRS